MKSEIVVKRLRLKSGNYVSELNEDKSFIEKDNPKGLFKIVVQPTNEYKGRVIRYTKRPKGGYWVSGEAYIITGENESEIDAIIKDHYNDRFENVVHIEGRL